MIGVVDPEGSELWIFTLRGKSEGLVFWF